MNSSHTPCNLERCSATIGLGNKLDKSIQKGLRWLLSYVDSHWQELSERVHHDIAQAADEAAKEREARRARVQKVSRLEYDREQRAVWKQTLEQNMPSGR